MSIGRGDTATKIFHRKITAVSMECERVCGRLVAWRSGFRRGLRPCAENGRANGFDKAWKIGIIKDTKSLEGAKRKE